MRWDELFADLEAQAEHEHRMASEAEIAERVRAEVGAVALADRLRAHVGTRLRLHVTGRVLEGAVREVGADFVLLSEGPTGRSLVPVRALHQVEGLGRAVAAPAGTVLRRLGLRTALRAVLLERAEVQLRTVDVELRGRLSRVGADHVDIAIERQSDGRVADRCVPLAAVLVVRSRD